LGRVPFHVSVRRLAERGVAALLEGRVLRGVGRGLTGASEHWVVKWIVGLKLPRRLAG